MPLTGSAVAVISDYFQPNSLFLHSFLSDLRKMMIKQGGDVLSDQSAVFHTGVLSVRR